MNSQIEVVQLNFLRMGKQSVAHPSYRFLIHCASCWVFIAPFKKPVSKRFVLDWACSLALQILSLLIQWNAIRKPKLSGNGEPALETGVAMATTAYNTASSSFSLYLQNAQLSFETAQCEKVYSIQMFGQSFSSLKKKK